MSTLGRFCGLVADVRMVDLPSVSTISRCSAISGAGDVPARGAVGGAGKAAPWPCHAFFALGAARENVEPIASLCKLQPNLRATRQRMHSLIQSPRSCTIYRAYRGSSHHQYQQLLVTTCGPLLSVRFLLMISRLSESRAAFAFCRRAASA